MTVRHRKPRRPTLTEARRRYAQAHERIAREAARWRQRAAAERERELHSPLRYLWARALPKWLIVYGVTMTIVTW